MQTSFVVQFADATTASAQLPTMKHDYFASHDFVIYNPYGDVKAVVLGNSSSLEDAVRQVG